MARRGNILFLGGIAAVLGLVGLAYVLWLGPEAEPPPEAPVVASGPTADGAGLRLVAADGDVEHRSAGGDWRPLAVGNALAVGDDLRTRGPARAAIVLGADVRVDLSSDSRVRLSPDADGAARVVVGEGLAVVDVRPESGRLVRVSAEGSDAVTETRDGRVHLLNDGAGNVQTAVTRGKATVTAQGKSIELAAGFATRVGPGKPPEAPTAVPGSLLLKVKWPTAGATSKRRQLISGTANPGARVRVGEVVVTADKNGRFQAVVELAEGNNQVRVRAVDIAGHEASEQSPTINLDSRAPTHRVETSPGMWKSR